MSTFWWNLFTGSNGNIRRHHSGRKFHQHFVFGLFRGRRIHPHHNQYRSITFNLLARKLPSPVSLKSVPSYPKFYLWTGWFLFFLCLRLPRLLCSAVAAQAKLPCSTAIIMKPWLPRSITSGEAPTTKNPLKHCGRLTRWALHIMKGLSRYIGGPMVNSNGQK